MVEAECSLVSQGPSGQISDGYLLLSALSFWATPRYGKFKDSRGALRYDVWHNDHSEQLNEDVPLNNGADQVADESPILVVTINSRDIPNKAEKDRSIWKGKEPERWWLGLALRASRREEVAFERIGHVGGCMKALEDRKSREVKIV